MPVPWIWAVGELTLNQHYFRMVLGRLRAYERGCEDHGE